MGLRGEVELIVVSDAPDRFTPGAVVRTAEQRALEIRSLRSQGRRTIVTFEGIIDRTGAEALRGVELVVPIADARALGDDEYWDHDLIGAEVVTTDGRVIGRVADVLHAPANEVLVVVDGKTEHLVPLTRNIVRSVEPRTSITIEPIPGLFGD